MKRLRFLCLLAPLLFLSGCDSDPAKSELGQCGWPALSPVPEREETGSQVGEYAPIFEGYDQFGCAVDIRQFAEGMILLDVGATWCGPCKRDALDAEASFQDFREEMGFPFWRVQVLVDHGFNTVPLAAAWAEDYGFSFPCLVGNRARFAASTQLDVTSIPTYFVLDPDLRIVARFTGYNNREFNDQRIREALIQGWEEYRGKW